MRRVAATVTALIAGVLLVLSAVPAVAATPSAPSGVVLAPADGSPTGGCSTTTDILTLGTCEVVTSGADTVINGVNGAASGVLSDAFDSFAKSIAQGATDLATELTSYISSATSISSDDVTRNSKSLLGVGTGVMMILFLVGIIGAAVRQDAAPLRTAVGGVFTFAFGGALIAAVSLEMLAVVDQISDGLITQTGTNVHDTIGASTNYQVGATTAVTTAGATLSPGLAAFVAIMALIALAILYGTLVIRKVLVITTVAFGPLAFAGLTWKSTKIWTRRYLETLIALILSKFIVFFVFALGADLVTGASSFTTILGGIILLFLAAFSPLGTYKLLHFAEVQGAAALKSGLVRDVRSGVGGAANGVQSAGARASAGLSSARTSIPSVVGKSAPAAAAAPVAAAAAGAKVGAATVTKVAGAPGATLTKTAPASPGSTSKAPAPKAAPVSSATPWKFVAPAAQKV